MNRNKQIEEMAHILCGMKNSCNNCMFNKVNCYERLDAEQVYNLGYRKASEVAREIFEEIEKSFIEFYDKTITYSSPTLPLHIREAAGFALNEMFMIITELKKKYTEDGE